MWRKIFIVSGVGFLLTLALAGCSTVSYYSQSVVGHTQLMLARQSVDKLIPQAPDQLRNQLELSKRLKRFAEQALSLPASGSYSHYVALEREYPVWNVIAAPEFSVEPKQWCYLVIGCAAYRGYFAEAAAQNYALVLQQQGYETLVAGAPAYSTLGWFNDPILPSMLRFGDIHFAETLFHELAHQRLYINGDSNFNEAFATVVGEVGTERWLQQTDTQALAKYQKQLVAVDQFHQLVLSVKNELAAVYAQSLSDAELRQVKAQIFTDMRARYENLKHEKWGGRGWYDRWFDSPVNNARLAVFSTYRDAVPELKALLARCGGDLAKFYAVVSAMSHSDPAILRSDECIGSELSDSSEL
ncbi:aminopeptidase [Arenicella xantha]|uniref:Putative aminopeptidase n=1 Tax=Arenicella xantha TaxID=644221 RepID=A0A395JMC5_9GAMM|nr:aminopeptidase [Arenicella xantha]RBP51565.1 putative aminopeptidase [Arenicella xantha]